MTVDAFIERWGASGASEHGNATLFLSGTKRFPASCLEALS
jgi:hypothetical protein